MSKVVKCFILAITVIVGMTPPSSWANDPTPTVIVIKTTGENGLIPRSPALIPLQGVVLGYSIYLTFFSDLGVVGVTLEEAAYGQVIHTVVDASLPYATIPFSGDAGDYTITFTLEDGVVYVGSFII